MSGPTGLITAAIKAAAPRALAVVARRSGDFAGAEDAVQEALVEASRAWARDGLPSDPTAWIVHAALRRWIDAVRSDRARRAREDRAARLDAPAARRVAADDDTLALLLLCCHPDLAPASRVALTLRAVGGLTTREVARGLLTTDVAVAQRISRAKARLRTVADPFARPAPEQLPSRIAIVLDVLGLIHTESHSATEGDAITRPALASEALRLARDLLRRLPAGAAARGEAAGLVALILLTDARSAARVDPSGALVPISQQDRSRWDRRRIEEGVALLTEALSSSPLGPFQLRAAIAAVHDEAPSAAATDHRQILALYDLLRHLDPSPVVELGRLVALGEALGFERALDLLHVAPPRAAPARVVAVHAHLLAGAGREAEARERYAEAARLTVNDAERAWLARRAAG